MKIKKEIEFVALTGGDNQGAAGRICHPSKRITDPSFKYTPACATNLAETFRRVRLEQSRTLQQ